VHCQRLWGYVMDTQENVLLSACEVFSERGYHSATTAEICGKAGANIAAVNYYYRGKKNLYMAIWEKLYLDNMTLRNAEIPTTGSAQDRLFALLRYNIMAVLTTGSANWFTKIVHRELSSPSPMHGKLFKRYLEPMQNQFLAVIRDFMGADMDESKVRLCSLCVHGPIFDLLSFRIKWDESRAENGSQYPLFGSRSNFIEDPESLIRHIQSFTMGGLMTIRDKKSD